MAYEALYPIDKDVIFRETFNSEQDTRNNGGIPTDVVFENGKGVETLNSSNINFGRKIVNINEFTFISKLRWSYGGVHPVYRILEAGNFRITIDTLNNSLVFFSTSTNKTPYNTLYPDIDYFIAVTRDKNDNIKFYINDIEYSSGTQTAQITDELVLFNSNSLNRNFVGECDFIQLYKRALTAEEINNLYTRRRYRDVRDGLMAHITAVSGVIKDTTKINIIEDSNNDVITEKLKSYSMYFSGIKSPEQGITINDISNIQNDTQGTLSVYINPQKYLSAYGGLPIYVGYDRYSFASIQLINENTIYSQVINNNALAYTLQVNKSGIAKYGKLVHITVVQNGVSPKMYIDGVLVSTTISGPNEGAWVNYVSSATKLQVGGGFGALAKYKGYIYDARYYNKALSANEVMQLYTYNKNLYNL